MITKDVSGNAEVNGMNANKGFQMIAGAKAFKVLSSRIYTNKIMAPIRELSTNAYDIHKQCGQTKPFEVTLPNSLDPYFKVRDFGTGLSKTEIMGDETLGILGIYTTYFLSTKEDTDEQVGCLGLGTKSPFAYTSSFTVTSYYQGVKSVYAMYLDGDTPTVNHVGDEPSDEPSGIEVSFGVQSWEYDSFRREAVKLFSFWNPEDRPVISGQRVEFSDYLEGKIKGDGWVLSDVKDGMFSSGYFYVVMGNIPYRVNTYDAPNKEFNDIYNYGNLIFKCDMGEVNFSPSRETLELDRFTVDAIVKRIQNFKDSIIGALEKQIDECGSLWTARVLAYQFRRKHSLAKDHEFRYKGLDLTENIDLSANPVTLYLRRSEWKHHRKQVMTKLMLSDIGADNDHVMFLYNDLDSDRHCGGRVTHMLKTQDVAKRVILINNGMTYQDAKSVFGLSNDLLIRVSTLEIPPRKPRISKNNIDFDEQLEFANKHILEYNSFGYKFCNCVVPKGEAQYFYIDLNRQTARYGEIDLDGDKLSGIMEFLNKYTSYNVKTVYGVRQGAKNFVDNCDNWLNIFEIFKFEFSRFCNTHPVADYASRDHHHRRTYSTLQGIRDKLCMNPVTANSEVIKRINALEAKLTVPSSFEWKINYGKFIMLSYLVGKPLPYAEYVNSNVGNEVESIQQAYKNDFPLIESLKFAGPDAVKEYLRLWVVDKEFQSLTKTVQVSKV